MVVHGLDGLDEISLTDNTRVCEIKDGVLTSYTLDPRGYGFSLCAPADLTGGDAQENAEIAKQILSGEISPKADIVLLNSAVVLYLAGKAQSIEEGVLLARKALYSGAALEKMQEFIAATNRFPQEQSA